MTGSKCLLDTSVIIHLFRNSRVIVETLSKFNEVYVSSIVIGELYYGAFASLNAEKHITQIETFLNSCIIVSIDADTGKVYGRLKAELN